jgi:hypothetical protein
MQFTGGPGIHPRGPEHSSTESLIGAGAAEPIEDLLHRGFVGESHAGKAHSLRFPSERLGARRPLRFGERTSEKIAHQPAERLPLTALYLLERPKDWLVNFQGGPHPAKLKSRADQAEA